MAECELYQRWPTSIQRARNFREKKSQLICMKKTLHARTLRPEYLMWGEINFCKKGGNMRNEQGKRT